MKTVHKLSGLPIVVLFGVLLAAGAFGAVSADVKRSEPTVERVFFDPKHRPADMPPLRPEHAAFTQSNFRCEVHVSYRIVSSASLAEGTEVNTRIGKIEVTISLSDKIYLPNGATTALRAHEEGHREINERIHRDAEKIAVEEAGKAAEKEWSGRGRDEDAAAKNATDAAVASVCKAYLARTADYASRVGDLYDGITDHGRNQSVAVVDAIKLAFAKSEKLK